MASLGFLPRGLVAGHAARDLEQGAALPRVEVAIGGEQVVLALGARRIGGAGQVGQQCAGGNAEGAGGSEEHTSELQSIMRISYAVFCLKNKHNTITSKT